jgi:hypothetical protein
VLLLLLLEAVLLLRQYDLAFELPGNQFTEVDQDLQAAGVKNTGLGVGKAPAGAAAAAAAAAAIDAST